MNQFCCSPFSVAVPCTNCHMPLALARESAVA